LVVEARHTRGVLFRPDQRVLRVRDLRMDAARDEPLRIALELLQYIPDEAELVGLVVDREVRAIAEPGRLAAQDSATGRMEGQDPDRPRLRADRGLDPLAHLPGSRVRERDREDLVRLDAARREQVR